MKKVFKTVLVKCELCNTPTNGEYYRGEHYYCFEHYQKTSPEEILTDKTTRRESEKFSKLIAIEVT